MPIHSSDLLAIVSSGANVSFNAESVHSDHAIEAVKRAGRDFQVTIRNADNYDSDTLKQIARLGGAKVVIETR